MKIKLLYCLSFAIGLLVMFSLSVLAKENEPQSYGDNIFCLYTDVPFNARSSFAHQARVSFVGCGGIKINAIKIPHGGWQVCVDGEALSANNGTAEGAPGSASGPTTGSRINGTSAARVEGDFSAAAGCTYFVAKTATCTMPSAAGVAGQEILVWNACPAGGVVTYNTTQGQTISGSASGSLFNASVYKLNRFMSDGVNWYLE